MKTPFRLDDHPRRPQPLAAPPDGYFDQLPSRVMQRVQPLADDATRPGLHWLATLSAPLRTTLAASVVLGGFVGSFLLSDASTPAAGSSSAATLAAVSHTEMIEYLLANERVTLTDLAELPSTAHPLPETYLRASPSELQEALDAQPAEETYL
ncbi:hypothetical protein MTX78_13585 [Hymenobacter tibetensis]|uniref:DUF3379 family protein n=1 Tax=Hymenobacter tibetensis TaxID=497967 RepID=A0ABY4CSQ8_9BACT|nr:hypothetical protein [Hymenobacter tibetensis]UOG73156.1 hypothetical protein MTX78_13585 [Hymenobacter tibetensis]